MGVVDEEYVNKACDPSAVVGRKITVASEEIAILVGIIEKLGERLYDGVMKNPKTAEGDESTASETKRP